MTAKDLTIFIGVDPKEYAAAAVLSHSILTRASAPVYFMPLTKKAVDRIYTRPRGPMEATEFSMTRFLVPYLSGYQGWSLFVDCDFLCQADIWELMLYPLANPGKAVYVCQHDYVPKAATKFLGQQQTSYPRKNWSSLMLFDNSKCKKLTPDYVNTASGLELHRFHWLKGGVVPGRDMVEMTPGEKDPEKWPLEDETVFIGSIPLEWNWLVGEYEPNPKAKMLHYTEGGPWFPDTAFCEHSDLWFDELERMLGAEGHVALSSRAMNALVPE